MSNQTRNTRTPGRTVNTVPGGNGPPASARTAQIDPRIRQRRVQVRREEGRRRLRVLVASLAVAGVIATGAGLTRSPLFDVDYVDVRGANETPRPLLLRATGLSGNPLMVDVHADWVARRAETLPWVKKARVRRQWPGTVRIDVTERVAVAVVPVDAGRRWALADATGRILGVVAAKPAGLPAIGGVTRVGAPGSSIASHAGESLRVAASMTAALRPRIADIATRPGGEVELQLMAPGGVVRLGTPDGLGLKFHALATVLDKVDLTDVAMIDVRVPRAPVLTRR